MKKVLIISFLIFIMIISLFSTSYAKVTITEKNLENSLKVLMGDSSNVAIDSTNKQITISSEDDVINIHYNLSDKPTFSTEVLIESGISYDDYQKIEGHLNDSIIGYLAIANLLGISPQDAVAYFSFSLLFGTMSSIGGSISTENISYIIFDDTDSDCDIIPNPEDSNIIYVSEFGNRVIEYVNATYPETNTITDSTGINSFSHTVERINLTSTSCKLVSTTTVNTEANFSEIVGYAEKLEDSFDNENENNSNSNTNTTVTTPLSPQIKEVLIVPPTQTRYDVGEKLNLDGLTITVIYENGKIEQVTKGYTTKGYNKNKEGKQAVTIDYKGFTRTYNVQVGDTTYDVNAEGKLPQTGNFSYLLNGLYLLVSVLSIALIYLVYKSFKYNKVEK